VKNPEGGKNLANELSGDCTGLQRMEILMLTVMGQLIFSER